MNKQREKRRSAMGNKSISNHKIHIESRIFSSHWNCLDYGHDSIRFDSWEWKEKRPFYIQVFSSRNWWGVCRKNGRQEEHWFNDDDDDEIRLLKICDAILHRSNLQLLIFNAPLFDDTWRDGLIDLSSLCADDVTIPWRNHTGHINQCKSPFEL